MSPVLFKYGKIWLQFCPYTGKYESEKACILAYFTQCLAEHFHSQLRPMQKFEFCQCTKVIHEYMNCLSAQKLKAHKYISQK